MQIKPTRPQYDVIVSRKPVNLFLAGQGSGKSHCAGIISAILISNFPNQRGIIGANTYGQLNKSTMFRIREVWKSCFGMVEWSDKTKRGCYVIGRKPPLHFKTDTHNYDNYDNIISFDNGAVVYIGSLDNYKSLDGMEVTWAMLDETKDTRPEAVKEVVVGRLRQKGLYVNEKGQLIGDYMRLPDGSYGTFDVTRLEPFNPLYIFTSPANVPWLNEWFGLYDHEKEIMELIFSDTTYFKKNIVNKYVVISSTYHNLENLPSNYIDNQKANLATSLQDMLIYGCPFSKVGGEFYKYFDRSKHVGSCPYDPTLPLHVSFDENVHPYFPMGIFQMKGNNLRMIDEIAAEDPYNTIDWVCREFTRRYNNHDAGLFIYGDATSRKDDVKQMKGYDFFRLVENALAKFRPTRRVSRTNPSVVMRGNFINTVLEKDYQGCTFMIDDKCKKAVSDFIMTKQASDGSKNKKPITDPNTKISYQPYGHFTDLTDYIMCYVWANEYNIYQRGDTERKSLYATPTHARI